MLIVSLEKEARHVAPPQCAFSAIDVMTHRAKRTYQILVRYLTKKMELEMPITDECITGRDTYFQLPKATKKI